jgi:pseudaminic acid synthase
MTLSSETEQQSPSTHPFVVAEISANHGGSWAVANQLIGSIANAGAKAVKFQHYKPETLTARSSLPEFQVKGGTLWDGRQLFDLYQEAMTPWEWTGDLVAQCRALGLEWFSTPFDHSAVDFLEPFEPWGYKIASFELVDLPLIRYVASTRRPVVMSTGMATEDEIDRAVEAAWDGGARSVSLLRCNSSYPAVPSEMDLAAIPYMAKRWGVPIGLSDHTLTTTSAVVAVALGATMIEKHVTLRRTDGGPDAEFSLEPEELTMLVRDVLEASAALGEVRFGPSQREKASLAFRRSLRFVSDMGPGDVITAENVRSIRPSGGLPPDDFSELLGRRVNRNIVLGEPVSWADIE